MEYSLKAIEEKPDFSRAYTRCAEALFGEGKVRLAAMVVLKAEATFSQPVRKNMEQPNIDPSDMRFAKTYVKEYLNNKPKEVDLRKLYEKGFHVKKVKKADQMPALQPSDADDSDSDSDSEDPPRPNPRKTVDSLKQPKREKKQNFVNQKKSEKSNPLPFIPRESPEEEETTTFRLIDGKVVGTLLDDFQCSIKLASVAFMNNIPRQSKDLFGKAIEMLTSDYSSLKFRQPMDSNEEVVVIKFLYARACTLQDNYKDIVLADKVLREITELHSKVRFPAVNLGFALMFMKLHRFEEALKYADRGTEWFKTGLSCVTQNFPGHPSEPMKETCPHYLPSKLESLRRELRCPPRPDAICRYEKCLSLSKHIIPSEKIYITDPDWRPYYQVLCRSNCALEYHDCCWAEKKIELKDEFKFKDIIKTPTEKDFFGLPCLTPDCEGIIVKFLIYDTQHGDPKVIEDKKLNERLEQEESLRKEAERSRREKEASEYHQKNIKKKTKKKRPERSKSSSEKDSIRDEETPKIETLIPDNQSDYSIAAEPLENMRILKKSNIDDKENEGDVEVKKKTKKNKDTLTIPLDVFNGPNNVPEELNSYGERINKLQSFKRSVEVGYYDDPISGGAVPYSSDNLNGRVRTTPGRDGVPREAVEESIKSFVEEKLRKYGPLKESDKKLTNFEEEANKFIIEKKGLINVLKADDRFGSYGKFICLKGDAEKAKKLMDADEKSKAESQGAGKSQNLGNLVKALKEKHGYKPESFGLAQAASNPSELEIVKRNAEESVKLSIEKNSKMPEYKETSSTFVQTDICVLDDEESDILSLQHNAKVLSEELQDTKDKLFKIQSEKKLESREAMDKINTLTAEKLVLNDELTGLKESMQRKEALFKEGARKEKELKTLRDSNDSALKKVAKLEAELREAKGKLQDELQVSFQLQQKLRKMSDQEVTVERLKLKCLQDDFDRKKIFLLTKKSDNEKLMTHLAQLEVRGQGLPAAAVKVSIEKLNLFSAELFAALDELQNKYEERRLAIEQQKSNNLDLEFDVSRFSGPRLDSVEIDTLKLLVSISLTKGPPQPPFSQPRSPLGPPPGLLSGEAAALPGIFSSLAPGHQPPPFPHPAPGQVRIPAVPLGSPVRHLQAGRITPGKAPSPPAPAPAPAGAVVGEAVPGAADNKRIKSTLRLINQLRERMPELTTEQADKYIQILRDRNGGKLSGLSVTDIKNAVEKLWKEEGGAETASGGFGAVGRGRHNPVVGGGRHIPQEEEDTECTICLEKIDNNPVTTRVLKPCGHKFHRHCIGVSLRA